MAGASPRRRRPGWSTDAQQVVNRLFVYGTLRRGQAARSMVAHLVSRSEPATMEGRIYALPEGYPAMLEEERGEVKGEILQLAELASALSLLDAYEGDDFRRVLGKATLESGEAAYAWVYVLADPALAGEGTPIADGDWNAHQRRGDRPA